MQLEKAFVNHMSNNGLTLECKQLIQLNNKKKSDPIWKMFKRSEMSISSKKMYK